MTQAKAKIIAAATAILPTFGLMSSGIVIAILGATYADWDGRCFGAVAIGLILGLGWFLMCAYLEEEGDVIVTWLMSRSKEKVKEAVREPGKWKQG